MIIETVLRRAAKRSRALNRRGLLRSVKPYHNPPLDNEQLSQPRIRCPAARWYLELEVVYRRRSLRRSPLALFSLTLPLVEQLVGLYDNTVAEADSGSRHCHLCIPLSRSWTFPSLCLQSSNTTAPVKGNFLGASFESIPRKSATSSSTTYTKRNRPSTAALSV